MGDLTKMDIYGRLIAALSQPMNSDSLHRYHSSSARARYSSSLTYTYGIYRGRLLPLLCHGLVQRPTSRATPRTRLLNRGGSVR
jgi:hypothetical protein